MIRCSVAAGERADPYVGSAPPARRWLLLEHPGPWRIDAVAGAGLQAEQLRALTTRADATRTRILLIRRPGRTPAAAARRWFLVAPGSATSTGSWSAEAGAGEALQALEDSPRPASTPTDPVILVCAHGVHDACCAITGRPVAAALAQRWPDQVWECSHVGGDRFAPNVVLLPDGFYYGGLDPAGAVETIAEHLAGRVTTANLRGMARFPPAHQAAAVAAFARYGPLPADAVAVTGARHEGHYGAPDSRTYVDLRVQGVPGDVRAEVVARSRPPAQLTCRASRETTATEYRVERLREEAELGPLPGDRAGSTRGLRTSEEEDGPADVTPTDPLPN